jgi:hypothetical protein
MQAMKACEVNKVLQESRKGRQADTNTKGIQKLECNAKTYCRKAGRQGRLTKIRRESKN